MTEALVKRVAEARATYDALPPLEKLLHDLRQKRSFVIGMRGNETSLEASEKAFARTEPGRCLAAIESLANIAERWLALDGGSWLPERHAREKDELIRDTRAALAKARGESPGESR